MKTAVTSSTLHAHDAMAGTGFAALQALILSRMKPGQLYSRRQLAQMTRLETSTVAGRCNELIKIGAIDVCGTICCPLTKRHVEALKRADEQLELLR